MDYFNNLTIEQLEKLFAHGFTFEVNNGTITEVEINFRKDCV